VHISNTLYIADGHAQEEVQQHNLVQQKLAEKEKVQKEENLGMLTQRLELGKNIPEWLLQNISLWQPGHKVALL
jgi:hypothetical protein